MKKKQQMEKLEGGESDAGKRQEKKTRRVDELFEIIEQWILLSIRSFFQWKIINFNYKLVMAKFSHATIESFVVLTMLMCFFFMEN